jgi:DNA invertase Pin-like site-specific DNA recombinase
MATATPTRRAIGIVRVSQKKGREGESFVSPDDQRDRIRAACERDGLRLVDVLDELDVSGGKPLDERPGLGPAVRAVERGEAEVVAAAYFDRLFRSLTVQAEVVERVERAGGRVLAVDVGSVTNGSAAQWLSGTMLGAVSEYARRTAAERSAEAQRRAVARGVIPWPNVPPGYRRGEDGVLQPDPETAPIVAEAFRMRAGGAAVNAVREYLRRHGIERSFHGVTALLASRVVVGEIHFGNLVNLEAHEPIVSRDVWQAVQRVSVPRGRRAKSDRLLARLGVLRCGTCGARMVVGTSNQSHYFIYRCPPNGECARRTTISAEMVERKVVETVRAALADVEGRASVESNAQEAERALERAQSDLQSAIRVLADFADEPAAIERLAQLRDARDAAQERVDRLGGTGRAVTVSGTDWDRLTRDEQRALIRATCERVTVAPGRGIDRVTVKLFGE